MSTVALSDVTKRYGEVVALGGLDLTVADGELLILLGPSGCGKTTALRLVAGLEELSSGTVRIGDRVINDIDPKDRDVAMVFQSYALYPHLSVARNIEFPLRQRGIQRAERTRLVAEVAGTLGIGELLARRPGQLSGGQRQRVALARAIVRRPQVFLMDEPLSNLDAALRVQTRADIVELQRRLRATMLYVTHDQVEAMTMGDRIAVLDHGVLQQVAPPEELYALPANAFVAAFLGSPGMNLVPGLVEAGPAGPLVRVPGGTLPLTEDLSSAVPRGGAVTVGVRPEGLSLHRDGPWGAAVMIVEMLGAEAHVICRLEDGSRLVVRQDAAHRRPAPGEVVRVAAGRRALHLFDRRSGVRLGPTW